MATKMACHLCLEEGEAATMCQLVDRGRKYYECADERSCQGRASLLKERRERERQEEAATALERYLSESGLTVDEFVKECRPVRCLRDRGESPSETVLRKAEYRYHRATDRLLVRRLGTWEVSLDAGCHLMAVGELVNGTIAVCL